MERGPRVVYGGRSGRRRSGEHEAAGSTGAVKTRQRAKTCLSQPLEVQAGQLTQGGKLFNVCATDKAVLSAEIKTGEAQISVLFAEQHHKAAEDVGIDPALLDFGRPAELESAEREG